MKKIIYFMHLDWKWIKQRPHFIAEHLSDYYDIKVVYMASRKFFLSNDESTTNEKDIDINPVFRLPFYENSFIYELNKIYMQFYFKILIKRYDPDYLWLTFPQLYDYVPTNHRFKIIYDCMDDVSAFALNDNLKKTIIDLERKLFKNASTIFVSSKNLLRKHDDEYDCDEKMVLVRNAFGGDIIDLTEEKIPKKQELYKIGFIGAIHQDLDFETLFYTLKKLKNIEYHLIGPFERETINPWLHDRIKLHGVINHNKLYNLAKDFDCLIIPFKLNDLMKSVDPVKIYEYINFNKPIIAVFYDELEYFSQYTYFYSNKEELVILLKNLINSGFTKKYSDSERIKFLNKNSWDVRLSKICKYLEDIN